MKKRFLHHLKGFGIILGATALLSIFSFSYHSLKKKEPEVIVSGISNITIEELETILQPPENNPSRADVVVLDARTDLFYEDGHIPGALSLDGGEFDKKFPSMKETLLRARRVLVYCSDRQCQSSKNLAQKLQSAGVKNISIYSGGWEEWQKRKGAIEK